jgi:hypothetical protein
MADTRSPEELREHIINKVKNIPKKGKRKTSNPKSIEYDNRKNPWEKQKNETPRAYYNFCLYRDYGVQRSIQKVFGEKAQNENVGKKRVKWKGATHLCTLFEWKKRAEYYDIYVEKMHRAEIEKQRKNAAKNNWKLSLGKSTIGQAVINSILKTIKTQTETEGDIDFTALNKKYGLTINDVIRFMDSARKAEQQAMGLESINTLPVNETLTPEKPPVTQITYNSSFWEDVPDAPDEKIKFQKYLADLKNKKK